jgi:uncharacterized protein YndB with AHSA1/START domain
LAIDVIRVIGAVTRELSTRDKDGSPARVPVATRAYDATREDLWDAFTNPERIPRVTVELSATPDGAAVLWFEHMAHVPDEFREQYGPGAVGVGWDQALLGLEWHTTGNTVDPESAVAWLSSEEGRSFVHHSSQAWCHASMPRAPIGRKRVRPQNARLRSMLARNRVRCRSDRQGRGHRCPLRFVMVVMASTTCVEQSTESTPLDGRAYAWTQLKKTPALSKYAGRNRVSRIVLRGA